MKGYYHKSAVQLEEFFVNMKTMYKTSKTYKADQMMEHPNSKKPEFKNYHQMVATVLNFDNSMTVMEQIKAEIKKVINCIMSDAFQGMYIDKSKMMGSNEMTNLSKSHRNIKQNEFKGNLWINMLSGLTHSRIFFKKHLKYGLSDKKLS